MTPVQAPFYEPETARVFPAPQRLSIRLPPPWQAETSVPLTSECLEQRARSRVSSAARDAEVWIFLASSTTPHRWTRVSPSFRRVVCGRKRPFHEQRLDTCGVFGMFRG